jgi:putative oxidoreductase
MRETNQNLAAFVGRLFLAAIFIISGYNKLTHFSDTAGFMAGAGLPLAEVLLVLTLLIELVGGTLMVIGYQTRAAACITFLFMIPVTAVFHNPATAVDAAAAQQQMIHFLKNIAIMGGLLQLMAFGAGAFSVDERKTNLVGSY